MRTCSEIERDLTAARSRFTAAEAVIVGGNRAVATCHEAAEAQAEVRRLEAELAALPPVTGAPVRRPRPTTPSAGGVPPAGTTPIRGTTAAPPLVVTPPVSTVATPPPTPVVRRRRATSTRRTPVCSPPSGERDFWPWFAVLMAIILLVTFFVNQQQRSSYPSAPMTTVRTPVRTTPAPAVRPQPQQLPTYRDCMEVLGARRELDDGRCDHLP